MKQILFRSSGFILICLVTLIYSPGCKKSDSPGVVSIVGTWIPATQTAVRKQNGVDIRDTSFTLTPALLGYSSFAFTAAGQYILQQYPSGVGSGTYVYSGGILHFVTGTNPGTLPVSITTNTFSYYLLDTVTVSPFTTDSFTFIFNRQ